MQKETQPQTPQNDYLIAYKHRMKLRDPNFNNNHQIIQRGPRSAQIKAIQKCISKLKSDNKNHETILTEIDNLNLTKYIQEISTLISTHVQQKDIIFFTQVATRLNRDYEDYPPMLLKDLIKQFNFAYQSVQDNKNKLKSLLLFTTQLFVCGFPFSHRQISQMLKKLVKVGTKKKSNFNGEKQLRLFAYYYNCDIYASFLKNFGTIFTTNTPRWMSSQKSNLPQYPLMIPAKMRDDLTKIFFTNYISSCCGVLQAAFGRIKQLQQQLRQNLRMSGQFSKPTQNIYNQLKQKFIFTKNNLSLIIQTLSSDVVLKNYEEQLIEVEQIMKKYVNKVENAEIFENQFEKELYEQLPQFGKGENKNTTEEDYKEFKQKLSGCKNKSESDEVIKAFEAINNKKTRKMLAKDILEYRKQYQLVTPYLCRIASVIGHCYRDLVDTILQAIFSQYQKLRQTPSTNFVLNDKKSRNLKYICQFTKYKIIDPQKTLSVIQNLIDDLKGYNIDLLISVLESVGRFLYLSPVNANKFTFLLSKLENFMKQKSLPLFTTSQLVNSINLLKPHVQIQKPEVPPLTQVQKKAHQILNLDVINDIDDIITGIHKLIKLPQGLKAVQEQIISQVEKYDFLGNYHYAYMIGQIDVNDISEWIVTKTIDKLQQAVKGANYQNCLLWSRFLGQLYKYEQMKKSYLFDQLYKFMDLVKNDLGVVNLVCTVLQTCNGYLNSRKISGKNQLFMLLVEFKKYIHRCLYIPMLQQFKIIDVLDELEPNLTSIKPEILSQFLELYKIKSTKQVDLSKQLDNYLQKYQLKQIKKEQQPKDFRMMSKENQIQQNLLNKNGQSIVNQNDQFNQEFVNVMNNNVKDLAGRIAKTAYVQKVIERKKERKKVGEGQQKKTVIGRCGNKFVKKEVVYQPKEIQKLEKNGNLQ